MSYLGENIKKLGFGLMRLPKIGEEIDIEQTKTMVDMFLEAGFTYFDTAFVYNGSEEATKKALVDRYPREKYQLASKNAAWFDCKTKEDAIKQFNISLERTGAGYFDFYLMHNLGEGRTHYFDDFDLWNWALELKKEGKIKHLGFSFHSTAEELDAILTKHPEAEFVQLQINYIDWLNPKVQSKACYEVARRHGKPVIIMEPVKGGMLANPPKSVEKILKNAEPNSSCASWAIRFAANLEGVLTVLSGMSNIEQMSDNLSYMTDFKGLNDDQQATLNEVRKTLDAIPLIPCTSCNYCAKVCPENIAISATFSAYNYLKTYDNREKARAEVEGHIARHEKNSAEVCLKCGQCEEVCPQHISIREELEKAHNELYK